MSIQIYILSKLMDENNYPYKLKKELSYPIPFDQMINLSESKLYYHFDSLSKQGLIEQIEIIKEEHRPDKQVFSITDKGRKQLPLKIYQLIENAESISEMIVGLVNLRFVETDKVIPIIERKIEQSLIKKDHLNQIYHRIDVNGSTREVVDFMESYYVSQLEQSIHWWEVLLEKLKTKVM
ncbi:PadR family transcriptional regulator [Paenibacillus crassostreae]|uniref:Transcriptional regulator n=1 Tax=Paenibacillus crassostreae TaxID=1763538 RepID=A0A167FJC0_9BACL|nr:helix-turn-helix transcriptional regulator [Paenibacillus crassostreae]AOZ94345.1 transcriptional regulator [Paenibacillus crassostreae]OAB76618.1 transcriptional regulator [Paenibacillus crassostreae]